MLPRLVLISFLLPVLAACAGSGATAAPLAPGQVSLIDATCAQVMGLRKGEYYYDECQESLSKSLAAKVESELNLQSYDDCRKQGLAEDSAALSACILTRQNAFHDRTQMASAAPDRGTPVRLSYPADELKSGDSYYNVTPTVQWHREQYSCAQLGFLPGSRAFGQCVADLAAMLLPDSQ
jgi:hypothetical protein